MKIGKTSIIMLTLNQFHHTLLCLASIRKYTTEPYELIVVDNGSTDLTVMYLKQQPDVTLICNEYNKGFATGCNQGMAIATGDQILFLNNDTVVTPNWLTHLIDALYASPDIGIVGPLTNYSSGHQIIPVPYKELFDLNVFAHEHQIVNAGKTTEVRRLIGFCLLVKRKVLDEVGGFDELYDIGNFEDDDLCLRAAKAGYRLYIANACFIHHVGHATMNDMVDEQKNNVQHLMGINRKKAKEKWGADIFDLIYKEDVKLSCCVIAVTETALIRALDSIKEIADEIIVVDCTGTCSEVATTYRAKYVSGHSNIGKQKQWQRAVEEAECPYLMLLNVDEYISNQMRRKIRALKRFITEDTIGVAMLCARADTDIVSNESQVRLMQRSFPLLQVDNSTAYNENVLISDIEIYFEPCSQEKDAIH
ncbi:glycosyltransferase family 2 protein [Paenibacillus sp. SC116]|uniref:glycosyltransferase family 2 protein n=1 Tax=Paenibacillus sp. SC116 TaxID=2968986 RepID=UPI00215A86E5|nr:glycosyltransferase family 2 protein [Paenibacillus sp. SC116]MCR8845362.1 glycosyltransferase family 2 protein [Paenibacillus sp. SC116]